MKEFVMQYFDRDGQLRVAYVRAHDREEAGEKLRKELKRKENEK